MGTAIAVLGNFESDRWDADVHGAIALASRLSALVKTHAAALSFSRQVRRFNHALSDFLSEVHKAIEKGEHPDGDITPERIREAEQALRKLHEKIKGLYIACKRAGLTNNTLTAGQLHTMAEYADTILELAELLELSLTPDLIQAIYDRAQAERESGEVFELNQVE
jgi:hypothetical protein